MSGSAGARTVNALIQQDLKKVGVIAELNTMEWNAYIQKTLSAASTQPP